MKIVFWNVDTQYDFMRRNGKLYVEGAEKIEKNLEMLTDLARARGIKVVNTADWHNEDSKEISNNPDYKNTFPQHCMQNTFGAKFIPATAPLSPYVINWNQNRIDEDQIKKRRNILIYKDKFDVFAGNPYTDRVVKILNPEKAIVYGVATNVCVNDEVLGLLERKVQVYVSLDAIKEIPNLPLPFENWREKRVVFTNVKEIYKILGERK